MMTLDEMYEIVGKIPGTAGRKYDYVVNLMTIADKLPNDSTIVEVGSYCCGSASVFALTLRDRNVKIYCIDPCFVLGTFVLFTSSPEPRPLSPARILS